MDLATIASAAFTGVAAVFVYRTWRTYQRIEWFTGSQDSLLAKQIQLTWALHESRENVKLVCWDPSAGDGQPPTDWTHGSEVDPRTIYLFVPHHQRRRPPSYWAKRRTRRRTLRRDCRMAWLTFKRCVCHAAAYLRG